LVENVVVILDLSRSSRRTDFSPTRHAALIQATIAYCKEKNHIDPNDRIALIISSNKVELIQPLTRDTKELLDRMNSKDFRRRYPPQGDRDSIPLALKQAFSILGEQIRAIGGEIYRILVVTDNWAFKLNEDLVSAVKTAEGLNIHIDLCILQTENKPLRREDPLFITKKTGGELGVFYSAKAFARGIKGFASKLILDDMPIRLISPREKDDAKYLVEFATDLRLPNETEIENMKQNPQKIKCQICFSKTSPLNDMGFAKTGRYCSFCATPMHLHCAAKWAQKSEVAPGVFRCPYCYTLLKISPIFLKGLEIQLKIQLLRKKGTETDIGVKMVRFNSSNVETDEDCHFCFQSISGKPGDVADSNADKIFQCSNCSAKYHVKCLEEMYKSSKSCLNCGGKIG
jgi:hypothetical protein